MIIAVTNAKGGTGKSTTAGALAAGLAKRGFKTLLVDVDPQGNATTGSGAQPGPFALDDVLAGRRKAADVIVESPSGYDVLPGSGALAALEMGGLDEGAIAAALKPVARKYDYILMDTPPHMGALTAAVITASQKIIVPTQAEAYATSGLLHFVGLLNTAGAAGKLAGILITLYQRRRIHAETAEAIRGIFGDRVFATVVRANAAIAEAQAMKLSIFDYAPDSNGASDYGALVDELLERVGK